MPAQDVPSHPRVVIRVVILALLGIALVADHLPPAFLRFTLLLLAYGLSLVHFVAIPSPPSPAPSAPPPSSPEDHHCSAAVQKKMDQQQEREEKEPPDSSPPPVPSRREEEEGEEEEKNRPVDETEAEEGSLPVPSYELKCEEWQRLVNHVQTQLFRTWGYVGIQALGLLRESYILRLMRKPSRKDRHRPRDVEYSISKLHQLLSWRDSEHLVLVEGHWTATGKHEEEQERNLPLPTDGPVDTRRLLHRLIYVTGGRRRVYRHTDLKSLKTKAKKGIPNDLEPKEGPEFLEYREEEFRNLPEDFETIVYEGFCGHTSEGEHGDTVLEESAAELSSGFVITNKAGQRCFRPHTHASLCPDYWPSKLWLLQMLPACHRISEWGVRGHRSPFALGGKLCASEEEEKGKKSQDSEHTRRKTAPEAPEGVPPSLVTVVPSVVTSFARRFQRVLSLGSMYWYGYDRKCRPVLWVFPMRKDWSQLDVQAEIQLHIFLIEICLRWFVLPSGLARASLPSPSAPPAGGAGAESEQTAAVGDVPTAVSPDSVTLVATSEGTSLRKMSFELMRGLLRLLAEGYPDRLGRMGAGPVNMLLRGMYKILQPAVPRSIVRRVLLLGQLGDGMVERKILGRGIIPREHGGPAQHRIWKRRLTIPDREDSRNSDLSAGSSRRSSVSVSSSVSLSSQNQQRPQQKQPRHLWDSSNNSSNSSSRFRPRDVLHEEEEEEVGGPDLECLLEQGREAFSDVDSEEDEMGVSPSTSSSTAAQEEEDVCSYLFDHVNLRIGEEHYLHLHRSSIEEDPEMTAGTEGMDASEIFESFDVRVVDREQLLRHLQTGHGDDQKARSAAHRNQGGLEGKEEEAEDADVGVESSGSAGGRGGWEDLPENEREFDFWRMFQNQMRMRADLIRYLQTQRRHPQQRQRQ